LDSRLREKAETAQIEEKYIDETIMGEFLA